MRIRRERAAAITVLVSLWLVVVALVALDTGAPLAEAQSTLHAVMHSDLKIIDPIWTTAYIVRNHG